MLPPSIFRLLLVATLFYAIICDGLTQKEELSQLQKLRKLFQTPVPIPKLQPNDRILFIGNMNSLYGDIFSHGFIDVMRQELVATSLKNTEIMQLLLPDSGKSHQAFYQNGLSTQRQSDPTEDEDASLTNLLSNVYSPTKIVYLVGYEILESEQALDNLDTTLRHIEYSCAHLAHQLDESTVPIIIAPLFLHGEKLDQANSLDSHFELVQGRLQTLTLHHRFSFLDLTSAITKVMECWNVDNQPSGLFTYDGKVLNARGHAVLAHTFLQAFGITLPSTTDLYSTYGFIWETEECPVAATQQYMRQARKLIATQRTELDEEEQLAASRRLLVETSRSRSSTVKESVRRFNALLRV